MLSRSIFRSRYIIQTHRAICVTRRGQSIRPFSQLAPRRSHLPLSARESNDSSRKRNGHEQHAQRGSIRPFTVLFLCVPIGYAVHWAVKKQSGAGQRSPDGFVKYLLADREEVSSTCSIFTLVPSSPNVAININTPELARSITSVQFKQPQLQIARSYTLLPRKEGQDEDELRFLIKRESRGEVSGYLHRLPLDAEVEVRGITKEYDVPGRVDKVVYLAGGTGIAPAMQIADILKNEQADIHILWANRKREDCTGGTSDSPPEASAGSWWSLSRLWLNGASKEVQATPMSRQRKHEIVQVLEQAKRSDTTSSSRKLHVDYFVDDEGTFIHPREIGRLLQRSSSDRKLLIVSGPEGFVNYWAGPKQWLNGREVQGPTAGVLGNMDTSGWEVVKL